MKFIIEEPIKNNLRFLTNAEYFNVYQQSLMEPLEPLIPPVPGLVPVFQIMQGNFVLIDDLFKNSRAAIQTKEIEHLHVYSRSLFALFRQAVSTASYSIEAAEVEAAIALHPLLEVYKDVPNASYAQQGGLLANFAVDCSKPAYQASVAALGLAPIAARILTINDTFGDLIEERGLEKEVSTAKGTLAEARENMDRSTVVLIASVNNTYTLNELGAKDPTLRANLLKIAQVINFAIHRIQQILSSRGRHHKAKDDDKKDDGTQTPETTPPPAPPTPPQAPDTTLPPAPDLPPQNPVAVPPGINPEDLNPPSAGE